VIKRLYTMVFNAPNSVDEAQPESLDKTEILGFDLSENVTTTYNYDVEEPGLKFEIRETKSAGQGMFAAEDIMPGTVILREKPLIVMPDKIFSSDDMDFIENWLDKRLNKMEASQRQKFYELSDSRSEEKTTLGIFFTNDMNFIDDSAALFPTMARVNHNCQPNADFICRPHLGVQDLVATRFISEGEEISISYLPAMAEGSAPSKVRKEYTRQWYGFSCICQQCCIKDLEDVRSNVLELQEKGIETLNANESTDLIEKLIKIQSKLPHQNLVCKLGFQKSLAINDWKQAVQFFSVGYLNDSILNNEDGATNQWNFMLNSTPVCINNEIYLFPN